MMSYFRCIACIFVMLFVCTTANCQTVEQIEGLTSRILPSFTKSMAEIVANDASHTIPFNFQMHLRPEPEGPEPKQNPNAIVPLSISQSKKRSPEKITSGTQAVRSNFLAIWGSYHNNLPGRESAYTPPDNCGDVGSVQVIVTANSRLKVFDKPSVTGPPTVTPTGNSTKEPAATFNVDLNSFFTNALLGIHNISDPHVRYDRLTKRWFIVAIDVDHDMDNYCCIAVSNSDVITSSTDFKFYYFNISGTGGDAKDFFDYPTLGIDKYALNIGGNMFLNSLTYAGSNMWVINKDSITRGVLKVTSFTYPITHTDAYTPQGVHNDDPNALNGYFVASSATYYSKLVLLRVNHSAVIPTLSTDIAFNTISTYGPSAVAIPQGDSIDGDDHRLCAAMIMKNKLTGRNSLWTANGSLSNQAGGAASTGDRDAMVWYEIGNLDTTPVINQSGRIFDGANPGASAISYVFPTIATSGQGHSVMSFSSAGKTKYPEASVAGRYRTDAAGTFQPAVDLTDATSKYSPGAARWGDFTQTVVDPLDNMTMWAFTQYADTINSWGVRAAQLIAPPPSVPKLETLPVCNISTVTISGTSVNNSEFFDPGPDANGPGFKHLNITVSGPSPILVTNILFVNKDTLRATFSLPDGTLAGTYVVTLANPDGQTATTNFVLASTCQVVIATIVNFSGHKVKEGVQLNWTSINEQKIVNYIVEKSGDSLNFQNFVSVAAAGNTTSNTDYSTLDKLPFPNFSYYRLKIYNTDGNFKYSNIIKVATDQKDIAITRIYPNPASTQLHIDVFSTKSEVITASVFDFSGRKMITQQFQLSTGYNSELISLALLAKGGYIIQFSDASNNAIDQMRIVKE